jgi:hypothetical protein
MRHGERVSRFRRSAIVAAISIALVTSSYGIQAGNRERLELVSATGVSTATPTTGEAFNQQEGAPGVDMSKIMPLLQALGQLQEKLKQGIQLPAVRTQSKLLTQLPAGTEFYLALPNYGDTLHQALEIFHQELKDNGPLRDQWQSFPMGPMVEDALDKVYQLSQYLGNEIVVSGDVKPKGGTFVIVAEVKKAGLGAFLQGLIKQFAPGPNSPLRILTPQQLLTAKATKQQALVLVRPDLVVITSEISTLKSFNAQLARPGGKLGSTPFGQRLAQAYQGSAGILFGADLEHLKNLVPTKTKKDIATFEQTGFAGVKYMIAEHKDLAGQTSSTMELSFDGPRHGIASWLAAPGPMGGLDFVSTDAGVVYSIVIKSPAQMFDDILSIAKVSDPNAEAGLAQGEAMLNLKIKDDLLSKIGKNITISLDGTFGPKGSMPPWKAVLQVNDSSGLQRTLKQLLTSAGMFMKGEQQPSLDEQTEGGQTYYTLKLFSGKTPTEVNYTFADGYWILAANRDLLAEALRVHRNGNSLAKSSGFQALRPPDHPGDASGVWYLNFGPTLASMVQQMSPEIASRLQEASAKSVPSASFVYGEENAVRVISSGSQATAAAMVAPLIIAAIAIPSLMKSKVTANEAGGAATIRTLITVQIAYSNSFPDVGYASDLASLGSRGQEPACTPSAKHACLVDSILGCSKQWCIKNGYRYTIAADCQKGVCTDFVVVGTPVGTDSGHRNFCASSDGVVRGQSGPPLTSPVSIAECQSWNPL